MDENNVPQLPPDDDRTPTQEDAPTVNKGGDGWVMPEPVFRKSSGYLPKGFEQRVRAAAATEPAIESNDAAAPEVVEPSPMPESQPAEGAISEQPHVTGEPAVEGAMAATAAVSSAAPTKKKRGFFGWLLIIIGFLLAIGVVAALAAFGIIWYFFEKNPIQDF